MSNRMTDERLAEIAEYFRCGNSVLIGVNQKTALELLQALKAERKFARKTIAVNSDAIERIAELEERLKQSQAWRDYYHKSWMGESLDGVIPPITDTQLEAILGHADVFAALKDSEVSDK